MPVPGELDVVIASELMEAARAVQRGFVTPDRTVLIASTHRVFSMHERTAMGDERVETEKLIAAAHDAAKLFVQGDFGHIAEEQGSVISAVLFGALAGSGTLPFTREQFEAAIRRGDVGVESSLRAFSVGFAVSRLLHAQNLRPSGSDLPHDVHDIFSRRHPAPYRISRPALCR